MFCCLLIVFVSLTCRLWRAVCSHLNVYRLLILQKHTTNVANVNDFILKLSAIYFIVSVSFQIFLTFLNTHLNFFSLVIFPILLTNIINLSSNMYSYWIWCMCTRRLECVCERFHVRVCAVYKRSPSLIDNCNPGEQKLFSTICC